MVEPVAGAKRRRSRRIPYVGIGLIILLLALREPVTRAWTMHLVLSAKLPNPALIADVGEGEDGVAALRQIWREGGLLHRRAVMDLLWDAEDRSLVARCASIVREGAFCRDSVVREFALLNLYTSRDPEWVNHAHAQLSDPDVMVRHNALEVLRHGDNPAMLDRVSRLLGYEDPMVSERAAAAMIEITGIFPFWRTYHNVTPYGREFVRHWWNVVKADFARPVPPSMAVEQAPRVRLPAFVLEDLEGRAHGRLGEDGRPTLLFFFSAGSPDCLMGVPHVNGLEAVMRGRVNVLGVCLDLLATPDAHLHRHESDAFAAGHQSGELAANIEAELARWGIRFPVLFDRSGDATAACDGGELPVYVLIDSEHRLVDRLAGVRSASALQTLLRGRMPALFNLQETAGGGE